MNEYIGNHTIVKDNQVWIDGIALPPAPCTSHNVTIINNKVFIGGYEYKNGKWKRTLRAIWHLWF